MFSPCLGTGGAVVAAADAAGLYTLFLCPSHVSWYLYADAFSQEHV